MKDWHTDEMHRLRRGEHNKKLLRVHCFTCNVINRYDDAHIIEDKDNIIVYNSIKPEDEFHYVFALRGHIDFKTAMKAGHLGNLLIHVCQYVVKLDLAVYKVLIDNTTYSYSTEEHANVQLIGHRA